MKKFWSLGFTAYFLVVGSAGAQGTVDAATRTISASATSPGVNQSATAQIAGSLNSDLLGTSETQLIRYHVAVTTLNAGISGFDNIPQFPGQAARASIWLNGRVDDSQILQNGLQNGYGNEFTAVGDGTFYVFSAFTAGNPVSYTFAADAFASTAGQGSASIASALAQATLLGADAVYHGSVTSSAVFDSNGNGYFTASTPEPSSLVLLASGLLGVVPFARTRRRRTRP